MQKKMLTSNNLDNDGNQFYANIFLRVRAEMTRDKSRHFISNVYIINYLYFILNIVYFFIIL